MFSDIYIWPYVHTGIMQFSAMIHMAQIKLIRGHMIYFFIFILHCNGCYVHRNALKIVLNVTDFGETKNNITFSVSYPTSVSIALRFGNNS